jgi:hypothetical protein
VATSRVNRMKLPQHLQFTKKRRKALLKSILAWASALTILLGLVKLIVEIILILH